MAQFVFNLQAVLDHRQRIEDQRQRDLAVIAAELTELHRRLRELDEAVKAANDDLRTNHLTGRVDLTFIAAHRRFIAATRRRAMELVEQMAGVQARLDAARRVLAEASKQRKVIEKLRDRHHQRWLTDQDARENRQLDEIGMNLAREAMAAREEADAL